ncbi:hypothetical protein [Yoonia litorea]|uniref:Carbohydrate binding domain-containing protein n=1 Tax=Yoonia litorea TaxID=1123755 RepID=A0A1I6LE68_9RHOB|nr:hypothetical protein [Yoonia litorea]SFS01578.1 Carbohydrate binding domain-containing protein [Yoonia litorea]
MLGFSLSPARQVPAADSVAPFFANGGGAEVAIGQGPQGALSLWSTIGDGYAAWLSLDNDDPTLRLSWRETAVAKLRNVYPIGAFSLSGSWNQLQSSGSGLASSYTGNRAISSGSTSATATVTVSRADPYDVWVHYTGRTSGGYVRVRIDGSDELVNEIGDPAALGFKAFYSYSETDLERRQVVRVASGLIGSHTVELSYGAAANPGGTAILLEAVSISADLSGPRILPPLWQPQTSYAMGDEVQWDGTYYAARANGQSGLVPPSHLNGIGSDGALDWRADYRPTYPEFVAIDYASEREYAARFQIAGDETEVGGQTHGHEPLVSRQIAIDGVPWTAETSGNGLSVGNEIAISEQTNWQTTAGASIADCTLQRVIGPGEISHDVTLDMTGNVTDVAWFYAGMLPFVHWDGESETEVVQRLQAPRESVTLSDYSGGVPANVTFAPASRLGLAAQIGVTELRYGLEAELSSNGVAQDLTAFLRPNLEGRTANGNLDWPCKAYIAADVANGFGISAGDNLRITSRHVMSARE